MSVLLTDSASVFKAGSGPCAGPGLGSGWGGGGGVLSSPDPDSWSFSGLFLKSAAIRAVVVFELYGFASFWASIGPSANTEVEDIVKGEQQTIFKWLNK